MSVDGKTQLSVAIEARAPHRPGPHREMAEDAIAVLARSWPERARDIGLKIEMVGKTGCDENGYVDALANTWGVAAKERLKKTGFFGTCFWSFSPEEMQRCWDAWEQPGGFSAELWSRLVGSADAGSPSGIAGSILAALAERAKKDAGLWKGYLDETVRHAVSGAVDLRLLGAQVSWLEKAKPEDVVLPPALRLVWLTVRLAKSNHMGEVEKAWAEEMETLSESLLEEDARLVCHADLHLAVSATNKFDFEGAGAALRRWEGVAAVVPGLRYWGQLRSSLGQHAAFVGDVGQAVRFFDEAVEAFGRLSFAKERERQIAQTGCYRAIALMDDPEVDGQSVGAALREVLGELDKETVERETVERLATGGKEKDKYLHHLLLRWLVNRGDTTVARFYLDCDNRWAEGEGHPWPLIALYRGMLIFPRDAEAGKNLALDGAELALSGEQGPTVRVIGLVCLSIAKGWGAEPAYSWGEEIQRLRQELPCAAGRLDILEKSFCEKMEPKELLAAVLPFNFR